MPNCHFFTESMKTQSCSSSCSSSFLLPLFFLLILISLQNGFTEGGKRRVRIPDDLHDVIDDEEDENWKKWGERSKKGEEKFDPPNMDFESLGVEGVQEEFMKKHFGPSFGFVKLRFGVRRSQDMVSEIAMQWTRVLKTGRLDTKFMAVDLNTLMFTLDKGQDILELKEFVLSQPEAYEFKIGDQIYRRPGDPPLEEVMEMQRRERGAGNPSSVEELELEHPKDEL